MKRLIALTFILGLIALVIYVKPASHHHPIVGIVQFADHPALDTARKGLIETLKKEGFEHGKNVQIIFESAQGNPAIASQISQKFVGQNAAVIVALGTTPAQSALQNVRPANKIPIVFASVTDPMEAQLVSFDAEGKLYGDIICGISDFVPPLEQFKLFKKVLPNLTNLGVIYNPGEANSVFTLKKMEELASDFGFNVISVSATKTSEVMMAAHNLVGKVDAIFVNNDNTALAAFDSISKVCLELKLPLFVSDIELADKALATLGPDQFEIGSQAGDFVVLLLNGNAQARDLGIRYPEKNDIVLNDGFARKIGVIFSDSLRQEAVKVLE